MVVLDTSAVLAVLLDEPGAEVVIAVMHDAEMSIVNLCEVLTKTVKAGGDAETVRAIVESYDIRIRPFEIVHALEVARLRPLTSHKGLGLGDRACLAQGRFSACPVLTGDRHWTALDIGVDIRRIR